MFRVRPAATPLPTTPTAGHKIALLQGPEKLLPRGDRVSPLTPVSTAFTGPGGQTGDATEAGMNKLLEVTSESLDGAVVIAAQGEVDISTAPLLREQLGATLDQDTRIIVDLSKVTFLDSTGLGVLIASRSRHEAGEIGRVDLVVEGPQILKVLEVTGLTSLFRIFPSLTEALGA